MRATSPTARARVTGGALHGAQRAVRRRLDRHAHARRAASCSSRSAASASTATTSSRTRCARGAAGALVEPRWRRCTSRRSSSPDTLAGARRARARAGARDFAGPVVAITGSNGKTTTKEMSGAILGARGALPRDAAATSTTRSACRSRCSRSRRAHRYAVIEIGMNHRGEIAHLAAIAQPDVGVVTNAGAAHLEGFGSLDGVARGEGRAVRGAAAERHRGAQRRRPLRGAVARPARGADASSPSACASGRRPRARPASRRRRTASSRVRRSTAPAGDATIALAAGRASTTSMNALAAAAAAHRGRRGARRRSQRACGRVQRGRGAPAAACRARSGARLIDDSYNANPGSVRAGARRRWPRSPGERWLVLGDMARARRRQPRGCTPRSAQLRAQRGVDAPVRGRRPATRACGASASARARELVRATPTTLVAAAAPRAARAA